MFQLFRESKALLVCFGIARIYTPITHSAYNADFRQTLDITAVCVFFFFSRNIHLGGSLAELSDYVVFYYGVQIVHFSTRKNIRQ